MSSFKVAATRMTLRVSRDSGRTWGPITVVQVPDARALPDLGGYPPCGCARCTERNPLATSRAVS